jgi:hypothetical protein
MTWFITLKVFVAPVSSIQTKKTRIKTVLINDLFILKLVRLFTIITKTPYRFLEQNSLILILVECFEFSQIDSEFSVFL